MGQNVFFRSLKGSINPGEHLLAFGTQKPENFNNKNRIYLAFWCVFKDIKHVLHEFFYLKNFFFWVCLFPTILWPQQCSPQIQKFGQKWSFSPKSSKINKNWFFFKFLRQIFRVPPEVHWVWFLRSYDFFWQKYEILNKKNFWKKKQKALSFQKKDIHWTISVFALKVH